MKKAGKGTVPVLRNNLFVKICLSFWLTTLFMIGAVLTFDWATETGPFRTKHPPRPGDPLHAQARAAVWIFEHEGRPALVQFAGRGVPGGFHGWLFDSQGAELTGGSAPAGSADLAVLAAGPRGGGSVSFTNRDMTAIRVVGSTGEVYALVALLPRPPGPPPGADQPPYMIGLRLLVVLSISGVICYLLARYLTAPIFGLGASVRRFASGELSARFGPSLGRRNDEIARLAHDFDSMAERIESLLTSQRVLLRDISHELRSPLARLAVALELCRKQSGSDLSNNLDRIEREAGRLNDLIEQLLTRNRLESGISEAKKAAIDLAGLIREIAEDAAFEAESMGRRVEVTSCDTCLISANEGLLRRAIENVARNALRYTGEGTAVEISLRRTSDSGKPFARIAIRDHGRGVPDESLPHLFRPFYRVGDSRERDTGGAGLGLAITEAAVRLHGGTVQASHPQDGGLMIEVLLPIQ